MSIIAISGRIGSGKDTVGKIIQYLTDGTNTKNLSFTEWCIVNEHSNHHMWKIRKFAGKLKQMVSILTGIPVKDLEKQEVKDMELGEDWYVLNYDDTKLGVNGFQPTVRWMLQQLGTEAIRNNIHPNAWVNALFVDYDSKDIIGAEGNIVTNKPDTWREIPKQWIITDMRFPNEFDAVKARNGICVRIVRHNHPHDTEPHISETALDNHTFDYTLKNSGTFEDLIEQVRSMLKQFKLIT